MASRQKQSLSQFVAWRERSLIPDTHTGACTRARTHTHSLSFSCCNFLCVVLAAAYLKYRRCRLSCLPFVWHFFSLWHTHTHTHTHTIKVSRDTFISHENANFPFSVFRVVQGEAKTPKINGLLQSKFCIFTCPRDWHFSWKMNIGMSDQNVTFRSPGSLFFNHQQACFFFNCFSTMPSENCKKCLS